MKTCRYCKYSEVRREDNGAVRMFCKLDTTNYGVGDSQSCEKWKPIQLKFDWGIGWGADLQYGY